MSSTALTTAEAGEYTQQQLDLLINHICKGFSPIETDFFMNVAKRVKLDPFKRQIYAMPRFEGKGQHRKQTMVIMTSIEGLRAIASRCKTAEGSDAYAGNDKPIFSWLPDSDKTRDFPYSAECTVWRIVNGEKRAFTAEVFFDECVQEKQIYENDKPTGRWEPNSMWNQRPKGQLGKCYDDKTEVLTSTGFKLFEKVQAGEQIMMVTEHGLIPYTTTPFYYHYTGEMVELESDDLNFSVTPNHSMVTSLGRIDASVMHAVANAKNVLRIPRVVPRKKLPISSPSTIQLAAAIMCDGWRNKGRWNISVSRKRKIDLLETLNVHYSRSILHTKGAEAKMPQSGRIIRTNFDKVCFTYSESEDLEELLVYEDGKKTVLMNRIAQLAAQEAEIFVRTCIDFDGNTNKTTGVQRFYSSTPAFLDAFELAAVIAGYAVSARKPRQSEGNKTNWCVTISARNEIPVFKWANNPKSVSIKMSPYDGRVWCVTVPSGEIVVRRKGFSMRCGNCAEAAALRKGFPEETSGLYIDEEGPAAEDIHNAKQEAPKPTSTPVRQEEGHTHDAEAEVLEPREFDHNEKREMSHWSHLVEDDLWKDIKINEPFPDMTVLAVSSDPEKLKIAFEQVPANTVQRYALQASQWAKIERFIAASGTNVQEVEELLRKAKVLEPDESIMNYPGHKMVTLHKAVQKAVRDSKSPQGS